MEPKFKIDQTIIDQTIDCKCNHKCLYEDFPKCGEVLKGIEGVVCDKDCGDCAYKFALTQENPICMCWVRKEIYQKYKK